MVFGWVLTLVAVVAWPVPPDGGGAATAPAVVPQVPASRVVSDFLEHVAADAAYSPSARAFVAKNAGRASDDPAAFIHESLAVLSPGFKTALDDYDADRYEPAADGFEALARSDDPFLAVAAAGLGAAALVELDQIERCERMLTSVIKTHQPIDRYTPSPGTVRFMVGYCQVHNLEYDAAQKTLEAFLRAGAAGAPERFRIAATQMLTELSRRSPGRLGDVYDLMHYVRRKLSHGETNEPVQTRQAEAVGLLDALIEEAEEQEQQGDGDGGGGGGGGGSPSGNRGGGSGAKRSALPGGESRTGQLRKRRARPGEAWGRMPPKARDQILQSLQKQFPSRYRDLLEQYYEQLAREIDRP